MRLGYQIESEYVEGVMYGFNEAEAHAPRIQNKLLATLAESQSFNEAEAHAPRIQSGLHYR